MIGFKDSLITQVIDEGQIIGRAKVIEVPPDTRSGFNFGYTLVIPVEMNYETSLIVEGINGKSVTDDLEKGREEAIKDSKELGRLIFSWNKNTNFPVLIPQFPRIFNGQEVIWTHMLSSNSLSNEEFGLKRVDIQLINMINDAKERLAQSYIKVDEKIIIDGFSASSKFANRFTLLHPELVKLCIGGGVGGLLTLPIREINGEVLKYPVGVGNLPEITDQKIEDFLKVKQFYYQGMKDKIDAFHGGSTGIIKEDELEQIHKFVGKEMNTSRWENTQKIYNEIGVNVIFESHMEEGHRPHGGSETAIMLLEAEMKKNIKSM